MARLTPIDYQMQVMNPMAAALEGYQAGFGQMQQLDEVRRQREADAMNRELQEMQMAQLRSKQEEAQAAQRLQADFYTGLSDGTMTIAGAREFLANPLISESLASTINAYVSDESDDQIRGRMQDTAYLTMLERSDPDLFNAEMDRRVEAAFNANNQEQVDFLRNIRQLSDLDPSAAQSLGMQMVSGFASKLGDEGKLFQEAFLEGLKLGEPEEYASAQDALGVRRYTEGPNIGQPVPGFEETRPTTPPVQVKIGGGLYDPNTGQIILPSGAAPTAPTTAAGAEQPTQDVTPASLMEAGKTPTGYESIPTPEGNMLQTIRNSPQETASISFAANTIDTINLINDFLEDPNAPTLYGTFERQLVLSGPRKGTEQKLKQILGGSFLTAVRELKDAGAGGSLTENEGQTAQDAQTRFENRLQEWDDARDAIIDYREKLRRGLNRSMSGVRPEAWEENQLDPRFKPENMGGSRIFNSDQAPASEDLGAVDREELEAVVEYYLGQR